MSIAHRERSGRIPVILVLLATFLIALFVAVPSAWANRIDSIMIDVELQPDGSAHVTQVWDVEARAGTELYIPQESLRDIEILDFRVSEDGVLFEDLGRGWNPEASREEKAGKSGIVDTVHGIELCWGRSVTKAASSSRKARRSRARAKRSPRTTT